VSELDGIAVIVDDITCLEVDAVVTATDSALEIGGEVDATIHAAAGPRLRIACSIIGECEPGDAIATPGFELHARHVIHVVEPDWTGGGADEATLLASCYRRALAIARELGCTSIAFPSISGRVPGYPKDDACRIAIDTVRRELETHQAPREIIFCCSTPEDGAIYRRALRE
jgi:O-acetyl-ADP-ribose deacetylase (regulator of RNase III)